jgi:hypothetical protein
MVKLIISGLSVSAAACSSNQPPSRPRARAQAVEPCASVSEARARATTARATGFLVLGTPANQDVFFHAAGTPTPHEGPDDFAHLAQIAAEHGVELLGPPPGH